MAETFEAIRRGPGGFEQRVCIKRILPAFEEDAVFVEAFLREARTSAALRHTNIVQVLDFGVADGSHYLALELIDGADLRDVLSAAPGEALTPELTTLVALDVAAALAYAHEGAPNRASVVHRDLSPSNVLVSRAGELKLGDFGIAKTAGAQPMTATGIIKGKVPYLPPEYIETGTFDTRGDLYALGVMLFEALTGRRPFDGDHDLETIRRIAAGNRPALRDLRPDVPAALEQVIEQLLAGDPNARIQSANQLLHALPMISIPVARQRMAALVHAFLASKPAPMVRPTAEETTERTMLAPPPGARPLTLDSPRPARSGPFAPLPPAAMPAAAPYEMTAPRSPSGPVLHSLDIDDHEDEELFRKRRTPVALVTVVALATVAAAAFAIAFFTKAPWKAGEAPSAKAAESSPVAVHSPAPTVAPVAEAPPPREPVPSPTADSPFLAPHIPETAPEKDRPTSPPSPKRGPSNTSASANSPSPTKAAAHERRAELTVVAIPFGDVWIDGKRVGPSPYTAKLSAGTYEVGAGDGRPEGVKEVTLSAGQRQSVVFQIGGE
jgi:serine/threonine protein kinase